MIFHLSGKQLGAYPEATTQGHGVIAHADLFIYQAAVDDTGDLAVDGAYEEIFILYPIAVHAQQLGINTGRHDVVEVLGLLHKGLDGFQNERDLIPGDFPHQHVFAGDQGNYLGFIGL